MANQKANDAFVLEDVELYFTKIDPENPVEIAQDGTTGWETQLRTKDKAVAQEWRKLALKVNAVREDKDDEESKILYWKTTLRRKQFNAKAKKAIMAIKADEGVSLAVATRKALKSGEAEASKAPTVQDGDLEEIDPTTIGNGSIANVRVFQYDYSFKSEGGGMQEGVASVLMALQITTLMEYVPSAKGSGFTKTEKSTKRVSIAEQQGEAAPSKASKATSSKKAKSADLDDDEILF